MALLNLKFINLYVYLIIFFLFEFSMFLFSIQFLINSSGQKRKLSQNRLSSPQTSSSLGVLLCLARLIKVRILLCTLQV